MLENRVCCWILLLAILATSSTATSHQDTPSSQDQLSYDYPDRYIEPSQALDLAELIEGENTAWSLRQLLNGLRNQRREKKNCNFGMAYTCDTESAKHAFENHRRIQHLKSPGRRRRRHLAHTN